MNIVLFGTGGHAKVVADIVEQENKHRILGLVSEDGIAGDFVSGYDVIASNSNFEKIIGKIGVKGAIVALGDTRQRIRLVKKISGKLQFVTAIHPSAIINKSVRIGEGTVVMAGVIINASTLIGSHCIINTASSIDHDSTVGDYTHVCPGCHIAGHVDIGRECWLGIGSTLIDHIKIHDNVELGAGSVVIDDINKGIRAWGNPARKYVGKKN